MSIDKVLNNTKGPISVLFEPTIHCNLKCPMCDRTHKDDFQKHSDGQLPTELAVKFLESLGAMGTKKVLLIGGGEPLCHPDIKRFIQVIKDNGMAAHLWTNGTMINEDNAEFLAENCSMITVSLDSIDDKINDMSRGLEGATAKSKNALRLLRAASPDVYLRVHCVISAINYMHLNDYIPFAKEYKINEIGGAIVNPFSFAPRSFIFAEKDKQDLDNKVKEFCETAKKEGIALAGCFNHISKDMIKAFELRLTTESKNESADRHNTCLSLWRQAMVRPNGDVSVCCFTYKPILGNLGKKPFPDIWNSNRAIELREQVSNGQYLDKPCEGCDMGHPVLTKFLEQFGDLGEIDRMIMKSR